LEPRQISNIINDSRSKARAEVGSLGGDFAAIIASLEEKSWLHYLKLDEEQVVTGIWWQLPLQGELCRRYGDILINDNTYARNQNGCPLNIGIIIDGHGCSLNAWYALHAREDIIHHDWVFNSHLQSAGFPPDALISDLHRSIIASARQILPLTPHFYCIHHLDGNVELNVRRGLGSQWIEFTKMFWRTYRAVSPEEFDHLWLQLVANFPSAAEYLQDELYPCQTQWVWAYTSFQFTCGVHTNGQVEGENRINKLIGGPKKSAIQLFNGLNERTQGQGVQDMIRVRDVCVNILIFIHFNYA
jgi:MULE transposase domain